MYDRIRDIPQFPHANYRVNISWGFIDKFLENFPLINTDPDYQRGYVWSEYQKERFIEYRLRGGMSGKDIFWNQPNFNREEGKTEWHETLELVDGKQRLNAVKGFLNDEVKAFGKYLSEYPDNMMVTSGIKIDFLFNINNLTTKKEVVEWYLGMNAGGSVHTEDDLQTAYNVLKAVS